MSNVLRELQRRAKAVKSEIHALYLAARDPRTPWYAKAIGFIVIGYAISPIDLIPDFIPVLGYLDDVILLPLGLLLFRRLVPAEVLGDARRAADDSAKRPSSRIAGAVVIGLWLVAVAATFLFIRHAYQAQRVRAG